VSRLSWAEWLALGAGAVVLALGGWLAYHRGQLSAGLDVARWRESAVSSPRRSSGSKPRTPGLNAKVAELEMARRLDRGSLRPDRAHPGRPAVAAVPAGGRPRLLPLDRVAHGRRPGLRIQRFEVEPGAEPRQFVLKLTLIQAMRHDSVAAGLADVVVHGMQGDRPARYSVGDLLGRPQARLPFSFRYFQTVEQAVTLPEGFQPSRPRLQVRSAKLPLPRCSSPSRGNPRPGRL